MIESLKLKPEIKLSPEEHKMKYHSFLEKLRMDIWEYHKRYKNDLLNLKISNYKILEKSDYDFYIHQCMVRVSHERDRLLTKYGIETSEPDFSFLNDETK